MEKRRLMLRCHSYPTFAGLCDWTTQEEEGFSLVGEMKVDA
jgi:hypothetical protein